MSASLCGQSPEPGQEGVGTAQPVTRQSALGALAWLAHSVPVSAVNGPCLTGKEPAGGSAANKQWAQG